MSKLGELNLKQAIRFMLISTLAFALLNASVKELAEFNVYQLVFFRSFGTLVLTIVLLRRRKISILGNKKGLLIVRALVGLASMTLFFIR